ncbi:molybdopterin-dependent oxidoreductase FAD-binding subunit [Photobacterium gaetbulicola]|uniref:Putative selenate reductase subunit YgfM n=1 Tax=Photobacterium gaetbulicola Gung47 TaxID=658445 RepID=A0A0C5WPU4_9GAMM|nr:molybdopterin-dependent oxidoreductase FAD-binding subunit [Photobacterium gaetbulicola]AJR09143.1 putative selenate reductase subunit YgfM [Photobacterium gaetbulicola Gung47]PSU11805.1 molybdopterin-dependent oxidoreductase FAD-binding subunit [Photobacterium gaetbulicola]
MIEQYLTPDTPAQALEFKQQHGSDAIWFAGGSKINAAPTKTDKTVAISLGKLNLSQIELQGDSLHIGAMCRIQQLIDHELVPVALKQSSAFIYSRHVRNQATLGGEIAARQPEALLVPSLIALKAKLKLANGQEVDVEDYINSEERELIATIIIPDRNLTCIGYNIARSAAGLAIVTAAVSIDKQGNKVIALDGVSPLHQGAARPVRLRDVEAQDLKGELLEQAVADAIYPEADIRGSVEYKRYIAGVVITDLMAECQHLVEEA